MELCTIADELAPFEILLCGNTSNTKYENQIEIRNGAELCSKLNLYESTKDEFSIKFMLKNGTCSTISLHWKKPTSILQKLSRETLCYETFKTFITFKYEPLPITKCRCRVHLGFMYLSDLDPTIIWSTNLSLYDTKNLMRALTVYEKLSEESSEKSCQEIFIPKKLPQKNKYITHYDFRYYVGLRMLNINDVPDNDTMITRPSVLLKVLQQYT
jgi:hypothetical protein